MRFNTLLTIFSVIAMGDGVIAILAPGPFMNVIWHNRTGPEAYLFVQGWGACLIASGIIAWAGRHWVEQNARQLLALAFFAYNLIASILWFMDALSRRWTPVSITSLVGLSLFTLGFGYFRFVKSGPNPATANSPA